MPKVQIHDDYVDIRVGWLDRLELDARPRRLPLAHIKAAHPQTLLSYSDVRRGIWTHDLGSSEREAARAATPRAGHWIALELTDEAEDRLLVDVENESPEAVAAGIQRAVERAQARAIQGLSKRAPRETREAHGPTVIEGGDDTRYLARLGTALAIVGVASMAGGGIALLQGLSLGLVGLGVGIICTVLGACAAGCSLAND